MSTLGRASRGFPRLRVIVAVNCTGSRILNEVWPELMPAPLVDDLCLVDIEVGEGGKERWVEGRERGKRGRKGNGRREAGSREKRERVRGRKRKKI